VRGNEGEVERLRELEAENSGGVPLIIVIRYTVFTNPGGVAFLNNCFTEVHRHREPQRAEVQ
jgi:hypothetical protein